MKHLRRRSRASGPSLRFDNLSVGSAEDLADCLESYVLSSSASAVGLGTLQRFAEERLNAGDADITFAISRLRVRSQILGDRYPLSFDLASIVRASGWERFPYTAMLVMSGTSLARFTDDDRTSANPERWFEEIVSETLCNWMGPESIALRFGWPSDNGRPPEFPDAIRWLSQKMNVELGTSYRPPIRKDGGVDVVVWRPFGDNRSGFPIVLIQCTLQKDLIAKSRDIDIPNWSGWLALDREPLTVLATPRIVSEGTDRWNQLNRQGLIFERIRLTRNCPRPLPTPKYDKIVDHCRSTFAAISSELDH